MSEITPIQSVIAGVSWGDYTDQEEVNKLDPRNAGEMANFLRGGIASSGIKQIKPAKHNTEVQKVLDVLAALEARAQGSGPIDPPIDGRDMGEMESGNRTRPRTHAR